MQQEQNQKKSAVILHDCQLPRYVPFPDQKELRGILSRAICARGWGDGDNDAALSDAELVIALSVNYPHICASAYILKGEILKDCKKKAAAFTSFQSAADTTCILKDKCYAWLKMAELRENSPSPKVKKGAITLYDRIMQSLPKDTSCDYIRQQAQAGHERCSHVLNADKKACKNEVCIKNKEEKKSSS